MKTFSFLTIFALALGAAACGGASDKVPEGQISARMIHNPRSAEGVKPEDIKNLPVLHFADTAHDFGTMSEGEKVEHEFSFKNEGNSPLLIAGASTSCGCTVPEFSREPIAPGSTGTLKVSFSSAGKQGHILKAITVSSNAFPPTRVLTITADVKAAAQ